MGNGSIWSGAAGGVGMGATNSQDGSPAPPGLPPNPPAVLPSAPGAPGSITAALQSRRESNTAFSSPETIPQGLSGYSSRKNSLPGSASGDPPPGLGGLVNGIGGGAGSNGGLGRTTGLDLVQSLSMDLNETFIGKRAPTLPLTRSASLNTHGNHPHPPLRSNTTAGQSHSYSASPSRPSSAASSNFNLPTSVTTASLAPSSTNVTRSFSSPHSAGVQMPQSAMNNLANINNVFPHQLPSLNGPLLGQPTGSQQSSASASPLGAGPASGLVNGIGGLPLRPSASHTGAVGLERKSSAHRSDKGRMARGLSSGPAFPCPGDERDSSTRRRESPPGVTDTRTQLFVGNLPFRCRWQDSKDLFRKVGTVLRADVALTPDNRSKGYGTVLFANREDAMKAIETYNNFNWQGRVLDVRIDQQDPTGALTLANANREAALQQMAANTQQLWNQQATGGLPIPPGMAFPVPSPLNDNLALAAAGAASVGNPKSSSSGQGSNGPSISESGNGVQSRRPVPPNLASGLSNQLFPSPAMVQPSLGSVLMQGSQHAGPAGYVPGALGFNPYVPGAIMNMYNQGRPAPVPPHYANRHLFVGNLPFNVQWQDLKDLFRNAGNIVRADVTLGPDGRSRGFGTVLFATPEDARNAVKMYNGYEWNGRPLKVHFDKFSQPPGSTPASPPYSPQVAPLHSPPIASSPAGTPGLTPMHHSHTGGYGFPPVSGAPPMSPGQPLYQTSGYPLTPGHEAPPGQEGYFATQSQPPSASAPPQSTVGLAGDPRNAPPNPHAPGVNGDQNREANGGRVKPPSSIALPPTPFAFSGPFSPPQAQAPLMTPSMPGFTFHHYPMTPPLMPQFLSPGVGPYSPVVHSPPTYPSHPAMNPAPGAPVHGQQMVHTPDQNPMFPPYYPVVTEEHPYAPTSATAPEPVAQPLPVENEHDVKTPSASKATAASSNTSSAHAHDGYFPPFQHFDRSTTLPEAQPVRTPGAATRAYSGSALPQTGSPVPRERRPSLAATHSTPADVAAEIARLASPETRMRLTSSNLDQSPFLSGSPSEYEASESGQPDDGRGSQQESDEAGGNPMRRAASMANDHWAKADEDPRRASFAGERSRRFGDSIWQQ